MAEYNIEINKKTATGFDQLYPKNKATVSLYDNSNSGLNATTVQDAIDEIKNGALSITVYSMSDTPPEDTNLLWIDTSNYSIMKYYNGSEWVSTSSVWG